MRVELFGAESERVIAWCAVAGAENDRYTIVVSLAGVFKKSPKSATVSKPMMNMRMGDGRNVRSAYQL